MEESFDAPQVVLVKYYSEGGAEDIVGRDRLNCLKKSNFTAEGARRKWKKCITLNNFGIGGFPKS